MFNWTKLIRCIRCDEWIYSSNNDKQLLIRHGENPEAVVAISPESIAANGVSGLVFDWVTKIHDQQDKAEIKNGVVVLLDILEALERV